MKILDLFDAYFLVMMLIQGTVVVTVDVRSFKKSHMDSTRKKASFLGWFAIIVSIILFILRWIF
ncbi:CLC_0170 family protein [Clostridium sp.]|uniref:CLC_0170 family protein n=1 Tax=Clostridium sp. TaxID=1506 RepID=UPI003D6D9358